MTDKIIYYDGNFWEILEEEVVEYTARTLTNHNGQIEDYIEKQYAEKTQKHKLLNKKVKILYPTDLFYNQTGTITAYHEHASYPFLIKFKKPNGDQYHEVYNKKEFKIFTIDARELHNRLRNKNKPEAITIIKEAIQKCNTKSDKN